MVFPFNFSFPTQLESTDSPKNRFLEDFEIPLTKNERHLMNKRSVKVKAFINRLERDKRPWDFWQAKISVPSHFRCS